jgi:aspartate kinase
MPFSPATPRVLHGGYRLRSLDYDEALEVARLGAKVLHSQTAAPAVRQGIPIVIRNSGHPDLEGTLIDPNAMHTNGVVKSIACLTNVAVVPLHAGNRSPAKSLPRLSELFNCNQIGVHMVQAGVDGMRFTVDSAPNLCELLRNLDPSSRSP